MSKVPVIPNCGANDNTSSPETKLLLMVIKAESICMSSTSLIDRLLVTFIAALSSVKETGAVSILSSIGASLTGVISRGLDLTLLTRPPLSVN